MSRVGFIVVGVLLAIGFVHSLTPDGRAHSGEALYGGLWNRCMAREAAGPLTEWQRDLAENVCSAESRREAERLQRASR